MYRLMIVEDEPIEREALKLMILENCEEISQVEEVQNGFEAIERCRQQPPHIAIVDINMPGINGLETIREIQKLNRNIRILILSAYNHFEFAQEAIHLGVEDFIVKPARIDDIRKAMDKIIVRVKAARVEQQENTALLERMEEVRPILERDCIYAIIYTHENTGLKKMLNFLGLPNHYGFCFGIIYDKSSRMILSLVKRSFDEIGFVCIGEQFHNQLIFFLLADHPIQERRREEVGNFLQMLLREHGYGGSAIGVGRIYETCEAFFQSYQEVLWVLKEKESAQAGFYLFSGEMSVRTGHKTDVEKLSGKAVQILDNGNEREIKEFAGRVIVQILQDENQIETMRGVLHQFLTMTLMKIQNVYQGIELPNHLFMEQILRIEDVGELENHCYIHLQSLTQAVCNYKNLNPNLIIHKAMSCINQQYAGDISLNSVAVELGISVFYLSKIIKKNVGKNFTDILAEKRIEEAKHLIAKHHSIKEVTYLVGFNSQNYFTKVFKKYVGCTPREYKQRTLS